MVPIHYYNNRIIILQIRVENILETLTNNVHTL